MPELPEVEHVRSLFERVLKGRKVVDVDARTDDIVFEGRSPEIIREAFLGRTVEQVGRKGKYFWFEFGDAPVVFGHLGMNGWVREWGVESMRLQSHGAAPMDDESGEPRFLKLSLTTDEGRRIALTDSRRLARVWTGRDVESEPRIAKLGPDAWLSLPEHAAFFALIHRRKAPIKAVLLDQGVVSGIGNWIADEVLYRSRIAPSRTGDALTAEEVERLRIAIREVLDHAIGVDADYTKFPESWMFHHRWGGGKGAELIEGHPIVRETIGGRTTAWVPSIQS